MENDIFRRKICDMCGAVEYKPYIGTNKFDGGYTTVNEFEPSAYGSARIGDEAWVLCPECIGKALEAMRQLKNIAKTKPCTEERRRGFGG